MREGTLVTFKVKQPRTATNHYVWDPQEKAPRVDRVSMPNRDMPADYGTVQSQPWGHDLLPGLLFGTAPVAADALVAAKVVGGLRASSGEMLALVTNSVDPAWSSMVDLEPELWAQAERLAADILAQRQVERLRMAAAADVVHQAQRQARIEAAITSHSTTSSWQTLGAEGQRRPELDHTYSPAEYSLWRLPLRFQRYVPDLVASGERVHYFVHRPEWRRGGFFGRTSLNEGLLVLTDRQVLFLEDAIPPGVFMAHWGYVVKTIALERLKEVEIRRQGPLAEIIVTVAGNAGDEQTRFRFPADAEARLHLGARLLEPFLPGRQPQALLRLYDLELPGELPTVEAGHVDAAYVQPEVLAARSRFERQVGLPEPPLADSLIPPMERGQPTRWLAVTRDSVILAAEGSPSVLELPFGDLTSIGLRYCLLGSFLRFNVAGRHWQVDFHSTWFPPLHAVYRAARLYLAQPLALTRPSA